MVIDAILCGTSEAVQDHLKQHYSDNIAQKAVRALVKLLHINFNNYGRFYIPVGFTKKADERHAAIFKDFTGFNQKELAIKYRVTVQTVYAAIKKQRSLSKAPNKKNTTILMDVITDLFPTELINLGVNKDHAHTCASFVIDFLIENFPGLQLTVTEDAWKRWKFYQIKQNAQPTQSD